MIQLVKGYWTPYNNINFQGSIYFQRPKLRRRSKPRSRCNLMLRSSGWPVAMSSELFHWGDFAEAS